MRITNSGLITFTLVLSLSVSANAVEPPSPIASNAPSLGSQDWPWWRGPATDGVAPAGQNPPVEWNDSSHVLWKTRIPGRGHSSPIVVGDFVFIATAERASESQSVLCIHRDSGDVKWTTKVADAGFPKKMNKKASMASSTLACDGERLYANFLSGGTVATTALNLDGKIVWSTPITDYIIHQGYGSSPAIFEDLVLVSADNKGGGAVAALERTTGDIVWRVERPSKPNYVSPVVLKVDGKQQLVLTGCDLVTSLDPRTGEKLWEFEGATTECVTSTLTDGTHIFTSGGYPTNHVSAVVADGSGKVTWKNKTRVYVPSMLRKGKFLYAIADAGIAYCYRAADGEEMWRERLGGTFSASPVLVGDRIYAVSEKGTTTVFQATSEGYKEFGKGQIGDEVFATPTICGDRVYLRAATFEDGTRSEFLYCIGYSKR